MCDGIVILVGIALLIAALGGCGCVPGELHRAAVAANISGSAGPGDVMSDTWDATDALGRRVVTAGEGAPPPRPEKFVGIFYWTWHRGGSEPYNVQEIITQHPDVLTNHEHPAWGPRNAPHHWNEPLFGFYRSVDRWVLRKHAELLGDAGVDVLFFDCTNANITWDEEYKTLCNVFEEARADGVKTPQIAFMLPFGPTDGSRESIERLYKELYSPGKHRDLWFMWKGKPLIMAYNENIADVPGDPAATQLHKDIREFFTWRPGQPDYVNGPKRPDQWGWLENYPQHGYVKTPSGGFEQVTVGVAQNACDLSGGHCAAFNMPDSYGRSYTKRKGQDARPNAHWYGLNFAEQWDRAFELDPQFVFITGWNEWIAGRHEFWGMKENAFPDEYDDEHSRDIEPMKGGHGDIYYYQMVDRIRRFKGARPQPTAGAPKTIRIDGSFGDWEGVGPDFLHHKGNTRPRDAQGYGSRHYTDNTGRNDIVSARVARDAKNVYFYVQTAADLTPPTSPNWMWLLIDVDRNHDTGWEGYDFILNRTSPGVLERCMGGWTWKEAGQVRFAVKGNRLEAAIPRKLLGLADGKAIDIGIKWVDNIRKPGDLYDFYLSGDAAPQGRFNFRYRE